MLEVYLLRNTMLFCIEVFINLVFRHDRVWNVCPRASKFLLPFMVRNTLMRETVDAHEVKISC